MMTSMKELEDENRRLKKMYADENDVIADWFASTTRDTSPRPDH